MTIYLVGNAPADFDTPVGVGSTNVSAMTYTNTWSSPTNELGCVTAITDPTLGLETKFSEPASDFWITFYTAVNTASTGNNFFTLIDGTGVDILRFVPLTSSSFKVDIRNGTSYTTVITPIAFDPKNDPKRFDVKFKMHDTLGVIEIYNNDSLVGSYAGDTLPTPTTEIGSARFKNWRNNTSWTYAAFYSQILATDTSTRGIEVIQTQPNAATIYAGQDSGGLTDINEITPDLTSDNSKMIFSVADAKSAFTTTSVNTNFDTGWQVVSVISTARAVRGAGSPVSTVAPMVRTATGVDAFASPEAISDTSFGTVYKEFTVNPDTTSAWTVAEANAAAVGLRVAT